MPARNCTKQYIQNGYYHIYNRGVEKRAIFLDQQDYSTFLSYLKDYLLEKDKPGLQKKLCDPSVRWPEKEKALRLLRLNNFSGEITLLAFCLMPNHFHLLVKQASAGSIDKFLNSLGTRYTMYFNKKYKRVGALYQGVYKAVLVSTDEQLLHLTRYIHKQALSIPNLVGSGQPSSYQDYIGSRKTTWVQPEEILSFFSANNSKLSYKAFTNQEDDYELLQSYTLED